MSSKILLFIAIMLGVLMPLPASAAKDAKKIKREQQAAKMVIKENTRKLESNKKEINRQMAQLSTLQNEIGARDYEIGQLEAHVSQLDAGIMSTHSQIDSLTQELALLKKSYVKALRKVQALKPSSHPLSYLFSATSVSDFFRRMRYVREFGKWRKRREDEIGRKAQELGVRKSELAQMQQSQLSAISRLNETKAQLKSKQAETDRLVSKLQKEGGALKVEIEKRQRQVASLDRELGRIIEADRRARDERNRKEQAAKEARKKAQEKKPKGKSESKPEQQQKEKQNKADADGAVLTAEADRVLTGNLESNKGRLLFPVSGSYKVVRGFGKGRYSDRVQTSHVGVDIQVAAGSRARAIFDGVVTNVSRLDGFNTIVVIRHGSYLTVYVNMASVQVKAGQKVVTGQVIGVVAPDADGVHSTLQFGLRKERAELNPLQWVK